FIPVSRDFICYLRSSAARENHQRICLSGCQPLRDDQTMKRDIPCVGARFITPGHNELCSYTDNLFRNLNNRNAPCSDKRTSVLLIPLARFHSPVQQIAFQLAIAWQLQETVVFALYDRICDFLTTAMEKDCGWNRGERSG